MAENLSDSLCYPEGSLNFIEFWVPIVSSVSIYIVVLLMVGLCTLAGAPECRNYPEICHTFLFQLQIKVEKLFTFNSTIGKLIATTKLLLCTVSWAIYVTIITKYPIGIYNGSCYDEAIHLLLKIDFAAQMFFLAYLITQFLSAGDKARFWFKMSTIIDFCTIPCGILSFISTRFYHGLMFARALSFRYYGRIFFVWGLMKNPLHYDVVDLMMTFLGIWFAGAGAMHLIENLGNFWEKIPTKFSEDWSYFNCVYFLLVTMSTVGYGDITSETVMGRIFVTLFILTALAYFTRTIPEIMKRVQHFDSSTTETFTTQFGERPVIVCGRFNKWSMKTFLKGFFHSDIDLSNRCFKMVLLQSDEYCSALKTECEKYKSRVLLCRGSPNNPKDLKRINLQEAKEAVILALPSANNSDTFDHENIMKAISLKIQSNKLRIILQLQFYRNKYLLSNFSLWGQYAEDNVVCMQEIKLGLIAKNAMLPGFSTLIANLLSNNSKPRKYQFWRGEYQYGLSQELYDVAFSQCFEQKTFLEAACIAYDIWGICLVAVKYLVSGEVFINPGDDFIILSQSMRAIVISADQILAQRLEKYCSKCSHEKRSPPCKCKSPPEIQVYDTSKEVNGQLSNSTIKPFRKDDSDNVSNRFKIQFDATGSFYWTPSIAIKDITYSVGEAHRRIFENHILILLCNQSKESETSLSNLIMPLRSRRLPVDELKDVIILCDMTSIKRDWFLLKNFPRIYIIDGQPTLSSHLQSANIDRAHSVVILSNCDSNDNQVSDPALLDTDVLLVSVNVEAMLKEAPHVHVLTDLKYSLNAYHFSSKEEHQTDIELSVSLTEPYAQGRIFHDSVLYTSFSSIFYNPGVMNFLQILISGDSAKRVENTLSEGFDSPLQNDRLPYRQRSSFCCLVSGSQYPVREIIKEINTQHTVCTYERVVMKLLKEFSGICIGIYRNKTTGNKFVYTNPAKATLVDFSDMFYIFRPN